MDLLALNASVLVDPLAERVHSSEDSCNALFNLILLKLRGESRSVRDTHMLHRSSWHDKRRFRTGTTCPCYPAASEDRQGRTETQKPYSYVPQENPNLCESLENSLRTKTEILVETNVASGLLLSAHAELRVLQ